MVNTLDNQWLKNRASVTKPAKKIAVVEITNNVSLIMIEPLV